MAIVFRKLWLGPEAFVCSDFGAAALGSRCFGLAIIRGGFRVR